MTPDQEAAIRARDATADWHDPCKTGVPREGIAALDRRTLLAEIDRLRGMLADPSEAMVEAALQSWFAGPRHLFSQRVVDDMHAALVAAGKAMGESDG